MGLGESQSPQFKAFLVRFRPCSEGHKGRAMRGRRDGDAVTSAPVLGTPMGGMLVSLGVMLSIPNTCSTFLPCPGTSLSTRGQGKGEKRTNV